jgi:hypothetical protein
MQFHFLFQTVKTAGPHLIPIKSYSKNTHPSSFLKWIIVNTDFSGKFTLQPFQNKRNDGIWAEEREAIPPSLIHATTDKFQKGIIFWGAISCNGLIPAGAPINFTKWLHQKQFRFKKE